MKCLKPFRQCLNSSSKSVWNAWLKEAGKLVHHEYRGVIKSHMLYSKGGPSCDYRQTTFCHSVLESDCDRVAWFSLGMCEIRVSVGFKNVTDAGSVSPFSLCVGLGVNLSFNERLHCFTDGCLFGLGGNGGNLGSNDRCLVCGNYGSLSSSAGCLSGTEGILQSNDRCFLCGNNGSLCIHPSSEVLNFLCFSGINRLSCLLGNNRFFVSLGFLLTLPFLYGLLAIGYNNGANDILIRADRAIDFKGFNTGKDGNEGD